MADSPLTSRFGNLFPLQKDEVSLSQRWHFPADPLRAQSFLEFRLGAPQKQCEASRRRLARTSSRPALQVLPAFPTENLTPGEGEQDERYDERTDRMLDVDLSAVRLEPREKRGKVTRWNKRVHGGDEKEQEAK